NLGPDPDFGRPGCEPEGKARGRGAAQLAAFFFVLIAPFFRTTFEARPPSWVTSTWPPVLSRFRAFLTALPLAFSQVVSSLTETSTSLASAVTTNFLASASTDLMVPSNSAARAGRTRRPSAKAREVEARSRERRFNMGRGLPNAPRGRRTDRVHPRGIPFTNQPLRRRPLILPPEASAGRGRRRQPTST